MKLALLWLAVLGFAAVTAGGCSISHRSGDFACEKQADCADGRTCSDGFCVGPQLDSGVKPDAQSAACPSQCTSCNTGTRSCTIDCQLNNNACAQAITCPPGWSCDIACSTPNACRNGITCPSGRSCTIACSGAQSCSNFTCGSGPCNLTCSGRSSCSNVTCGGGACNVDCAGNGACAKVSCGSSCACDVACRPGSACANLTGLTCKASQCITQPPFAGCTSLAPTCNTCP